MKFKAVLIGDSGVGKTALFQRMENDTFQDAHIPTVGGAYSKLSIQSKNGHQYDIGLWDTAGQERFKNVVPMYFQCANIIIVVYDITLQDTFQNVASWVELANQKAPEYTKMILVGNKSDLSENRAVTLQEMQDLVEQLHFSTGLETSALTGEGIKFLLETFSNICDETVDLLDLNNTDLHEAKPISDIEVQNEQAEPAQQQCC